MEEISSHESRENRELPGQISFLFVWIRVIRCVRKSLTDLVT